MNAFLDHTFLANLFCSELDAGLNSEARAIVQVAPPETLLFTTTAEVIRTLSKIGREVGRWRAACPAAGAMKKWKRLQVHELTTAHLESAAAHMCDRQLSNIEGEFLDWTALAFIEAERALGIGYVFAFHVHARQAQQRFGFTVIEYASALGGPDTRRR